MDLTHTFELPEDLKSTMSQARKLEWITIAYLVSVVIVMFLVMGSSQAMKSAWLEDALSMLPAISFLIASSIYTKSPNKQFPYGYHRVFSIAFLTGSVALFAIGGYLAVDALINLISAEHPTIGGMMLFGHHIWMGWVMIAALCYSALPAMLLGYKKQPLAKKLHNKILFTDADTQKADYMTAFAAMLGIVGVGYGLWWADAVAALFISLSVLKDGYSNLKNAIMDLMDRRPHTIQNEKPDTLIMKLESYVSSLPWVETCLVRVREHGQVYFGEIYVVNKEPKTAEQLEDTINTIKEMDWKLFDIIIVPVSQLKKFSNN